ncbi:MAG: HAD family phosphatase [Eubacteriales bacterium]|nr:HAD family phosphatase [Eubacteriales bacterium]
MIKAAIFDVDGTLLDSMPMWHDAGARYLKTLGIEAEPNMGDKLFVMSMDMSASYLKDNYNLTQTIDEIKTGINKTMEKFYFYEAQPKPGVVDFLDKLEHEKTKMTIATSTDRYVIEAALKRTGLDRYFDGIFTCSEVGKSKSHPDIFYQAAGLMESEPEDTWVFEDGLYAIKTAKIFGFKVVGVYDIISCKDQEEIEKISDIYVKNLDKLCV